MLSRTKIGNNLNTLHYSGCNRCTDASLRKVVQHCPNLVELWADDTGVTQIPESIGQDLPELREELCLENNDIKTIPPSIALLRHVHTKRGLRISAGNPLQHPPPPPPSLEIAQKEIKEEDRCCVTVLFAVPAAIAKATLAVCLVPVGCCICCFEVCLCCCCCPWCEECYHRNCGK